MRQQCIAAGLVRAEEFSDSRRMAREYWDVFELALSAEHSVNVLIGAYADGWAGPRLDVQVAPGDRARVLEVEISAPDWLPHRGLRLQARTQGSGQTTTFNLSRGSNATCKVPLDAQGTHVAIGISPSFIPARSGHGDDPRELTLVLRRCGIVDAQGARVELFPEEASA